MTSALVLKLSFCAVGLMIVAFEFWRSGTGVCSFRVSRLLIQGLAVLQLGFMAFIFVNHVTFPLHLDVLEGVMLQHVHQAVNWLPIYPAPSSAFVPMAYNPLYYMLSVPFTWVFGLNLVAMRTATVLATIGCATVIYLVVLHKTGSRWWGLIALGLFAASYHAMDNYFDVAHADMWMLLAMLLGTYILDTKSGLGWDLVATAILISSFWFKQHGAFFALAGLGYITVSRGYGRSLACWALAIVLGPFVYVVLGTLLFGPAFHYFTWVVPRQWSDLSLRSATHFAAFFGKASLFLAIAVAVDLLHQRKTRKWRLDPWILQLVASVLSAGLSTLDVGSSYNNFIPMGTMFVLLGAVGLSNLDRVTGGLWQQRGISFALVLCTFGMLCYDPQLVTVRPGASRSYDDFVATLKGMGGEVYAPAIGQLEGDFTFRPAAHWSALEDMIRGPGRSTTNNPLTREMLLPALHPKGNAFILTHKELRYYPWLKFLENDYVLVKDYGNRFEALRVLPVLWDQGWPRYLYRYVQPSDTSRTRGSL